MEADRPDYKSQLQHHAQRDQVALPRYVVVAAKGPEHKKEFTIRVQLAGRVFPTATGQSKKLAEQRAARLALEELRSEQDEAPD